MAFATIQTSLPYFQNLNFNLNFCILFCTINLGTFQKMEGDLFYGTFFCENNTG